MRYTEETLQSWTAPLSKTEEQRAENTIAMIKLAINESRALGSMNIEVFAQGSFANNTNVRADSDVDVCVMLKDVFHTRYPDGKKREDYGFTAAELTFREYRSMVKKAIEEKFRYENVRDGNKSLKINENTYHVQADVVPSFQLRNYYYHSSTDPNRYVEGIRFESQKGENVENYPKVHINNGTEKNKNTNGRYKKLVRIMKHIKNNMVEEGVTDGDKITSFLIECLIFQVPDNILTADATWAGLVKQTIFFLYNEINEGRHEKWTEVSGMLYLFRGRKWTDADVKTWLMDAWNYLGCAN